MNEIDLERLAALLPAVIRQRDAEVGGPLRDLLAVIDEQVHLLEDDQDQLYADWFVETCRDWVLPYLGDLVGVVPLPGTALGAPVAWRSPRADVANAVADRRRKGTLGVLEQLAADSAGWPARISAGFRALLIDQPVGRFGLDPAADARRLRRGRILDVRSAAPLDLLDGPFDRAAHRVEVPRAGSHRRSGRYGIGDLTLFVWRLQQYAVTRSPAYCNDRVSNHYTFSVLGNDTPLVNLPVGEATAWHVAGEENVPGFIRRRRLAERLADLYGPARSLMVYRGEDPVPAADVVVADLSGWAYRPTGTQVAIDPMLGRIAFPVRRPPQGGVWVSYHYAFSADLGGGEYPRDVPRRPAGSVYRVGPGAPFERIQSAIEAWQVDKAADPVQQDAVIEIIDSGAYTEQLSLSLQRGDRITLRAAPGVRPALRLLDWYSNRPDALQVIGPDPRPPGAGAPDQPAPRIAFEGLLVTGRGIQVAGDVAEVVIRHCTLVPGWSLDGDCQPRHRTEPSVTLENTVACVRIENSITGSLVVNDSETAVEPVRLRVSDSIVDATGDLLPAVARPDGGPAHAVLTIVRGTVYGEVCVQAVDLLENSLFTGSVQVARRQVGCVRFCYLPPDSRAPRRFGCQPDGVVAAVADAVRRGTLPAELAARTQDDERRRVRPVFTSKLYGTPGYAQLALGGPDEIASGADDESEPGAFHDLYQPQRAANLVRRLDEFTPAGSDAGIVFVT